MLRIARPLAAALATTLLVVACANPVAPSGGPRDTTPPSIAASRPTPDTVNVSTDRRTVRIEFSEYVERSTLPQALSTTPAFEGELRFNWDGQAVEIELPESLRDSTTYIFSLGTELSDTRGVSLESPLTLAFSTGPRINQGRIQGRVVRPAWGTALSGVDVFAYAVPDTGAGRAPPAPRSEAPDYRTQTGEDGRFSFSYLREQRYYIVALRDNNRNRRLDPTEPFAVPPHPALPADSTEQSVPVPWLLTRADTAGPALQGVEPLSRRRVRLRFDEPVRLTTVQPRAWGLRDSARGDRVPVTGVYGAPDRAAAVVLRTAPMDSTRYRLRIGPALVADTLGQAALPDTARFRAVTRTDTTRTRFRAFLPEGLSPLDTTATYPLLPDARPGVRFNQAPDSTTLRRVLSVEDTTGRPLAYALDTDNGRDYRVRPDSAPRPGNEAVLVVDGQSLAGPDTTYRRRFRRVTSRRLGGLEGQVARADTLLRTPRARPSDTTGPQRPDPSAAGDTGQAVVELRSEETTIPVPPRQKTVVPGSTFVFGQLPEGTYRFRAYLDRNGNGRWDGGTLRPYTPPEPRAWSTQPAEARPRWTTVIPSSLRLLVLRVAPTPAPPSPSADTTAPDTTGASPDPGN